MTLLFAKYVREVAEPLPSDKAHPLRGVRKMRNAGVTSHAFVVDRPEKTALRPRVTDGINNQPSAIDLDGPMRADNVRALREIRTLRSEGAGGGRLPPATR